MLRKRRPADIALGFFLLSHPGPVLFHVLAVTVFTLLAAWPVFAWRVILLAIGAHTAMQLSIAFLNDYCDRALDAASKRYKPLVLGLIQPGEALLAGLALIVLMVALLIPLNAWALVISLVYLTLGQAYNFGLKATVWSGIVFALAMPLIPLYAFAAVGRVPSFLLWLALLGFLLGVALNVANSLPDLEEDAAHGAATLAVILGLTRSFWTCQLALILAATLVGVITLWRIVTAQPWIILATLLIASGMIGGMCLSWSLDRSAQARRRYFYLVALTCLVLAAGWLVGVLI